MNLTKIESINDYEKAIQEHCILVFSALWCPDCLFLKTFIDDLVKNNADWKFYYVDRDQFIDLCIDLDIMGIPSFVAYDQGVEVGRFVSKLRKTQEEIQRFIDELK